MEFDWDDAKNALNEAKHGISFCEATLLWADQDMVSICSNRGGERGWIALARAYGAVWAVVYTMRGDAIRIISARRATAKEVAAYGKANR